MPNKQVAIREEITFAKLHAEWHMLLLLRAPGFCWKGSDYGRPKPTQTPCKEGLEHYCAPLTGLAKAAPVGFPRQVRLRNCFIAFDEKYKIFEASDRSRFRACDDAADLWRKMLKDAVAVKRSGIFSHLLQPLMDALRLEAAAPSPSAEPSSSTTLGLIGFPRSR